MKRTAVWLLICALLMSAIPAFAITGEEALEKVSGYLTEVYGYTVEQADAFTAVADQRGNEWVITFWPQENENWKYTAVYDAERDRVTNAVTPFKAEPQHIAYPGESAVRMGLTQARENSWFSQWNYDHRQELTQYMTQMGIRATPRLTEGLSLGKVTAGDALHEYFISCYGEPMNWSPELKAWHDAELASYGLSYTDAPPVEKGVVTYTGYQLSGQDMRLTRFIGEVPEQLQQVLVHPKLEGWTCICGAMSEGIENQVAYGLAVFEKDAERLLVACKKNQDGGEWSISPVSKQVLYTDREMYILPAESSLNEATIVYQNSETETERFNVHVVNLYDGQLDVSLSHYTRMDEAAGNGISIEAGYGSTAVRVYENHQRVGEEKRFPTMPRRMGLMDIKQFPTTLETLESMAAVQIPEGYAVVSGVHLRKKTSSRSKDLGDYNGGVLVKLLDTVPGDPDPWYHVQAGLAEGYMSSNYVDVAPYADMSLSALPLAQAQKEIRLKRGTSWLSGTIQKVPEGALMHVLAECDGGWLHVSIPQGDAGWKMDINGTDGYIKEKDVLIADTPLQLEWLQ